MAEISRRVFLAGAAAAGALMTRAAGAAELVGAGTERPIVSLVVPSRTYVEDEDGSLVDLERLEGAVAGLKRLGFEVVRTPGPWRDWKRYGGTDAERAEELQAALTDPDVDLVQPVRGGCGMLRVLPRLDWKAIRRRKPLAMGFSDFTAFNIALFAKTGLPSWQGPMSGGLAPGHTTFTSQKNFLRALLEPEWRTEWACDGVDGVAARDCEAEGVLWGGNLAMLTSLVGTPWMPEKKAVEGGILFLEDVGETAYKIDRMLLQLEAAGYLASQKAVVFCTFTGADKGASPKGDLMLADVLSDTAERLSKAGVACVAGLSYGHIDELTAIPVGVRAKLEVRGGRARLSSSVAPVISRGRAVLLESLARIEEEERLKAAEAMFSDTPETTAGAQAEVRPEATGETVSKAANDAGAGSAEAQK